MPLIRPPRNPATPFDNQVYIVRRKCADITLYCSVGGIQFATPPGFSGTPFMTAGVALADSAAPTYNVNVIPFEVTPSLTSLVQLADIGSLFSEYQIRACTLQFQLLCGESYNAAQPLPEVTVYADPNGQGPPASVELADAHVVMGQTIPTARPLTYRARPTPALLLYNGVVTTEYAQAQNLWINAVTSGDLKHYAFAGMFRNFNVTAASGLIVRCTCILDVACRRVH
jgi:hypothetical protein